MFFISEDSPRFKRFIEEYFALRREQVWSSKIVDTKVYNFIFI